MRKLVVEWDHIWVMYFIMGYIRTFVELNTTHVHTHAKSIICIVINQLLRQHKVFVTELKFKSGI